MIVQFSETCEGFTKSGRGLFSLVVYVRRSSRLQRCGGEEREKVSTD